MNAFQFNTTGSIVFGEGAASRLGELVHPRGRRVLLVTDPGVMRAGLVTPIRDALDQQGLTHHLFDEVEADPPEALVLRAAQAARQAQVDVVLGIGGGSSLDVAKLVALLLGSEQSLTDMYGVNQARGQRLPLILVPTTAGTGSEVTPISIVTTGAHEKKGVVSPLLLPDVALLDPRLTAGLPAPVTAATGIDAMVHAIEAFTSANANNNPISRGLALQALQLLGANIKQAVNAGHDMAARSGMLLGSLLAGQAFANAPVAAVHALAYPLGGHYGIPHGLSNALMLPHVLRFNAPVSAQAYAEIAPYVFPALRGDEGQAACSRFIEAMAALCADIGLPTRLRDLNIAQADCNVLAEDAMKQTRLLVNNPRPVRYEDALAIYQAAW
ncbi:iron-containing alcohol dehydrogenase [Bordetella genomosp. 12]|uniref:Alcohol dehydrogenase n=1 Tax=Bordetella genomosp. 12 TaxID=463035 RepID=A0A261VCJ8_9BORD|nr:iron-containing alcohol dehydrogenase [Bordetella genomosp. 12]OZI71868.1 alcohol dehydrogenase [Bordetella genomosp. 12]